MATVSERARPGRRRPGDPPSLTAAAIPSALGVLLLVLGWIDVSGEAAFADQSIGLNLAILGALVVLVGCGFYLWAFRRRMQRRLRALRARTLGEAEALP
ncbi:MAG: hypothetical protein ACT4PP_16050 [Sporichthyaceae bacterium]